MPIIRSDLKLSGTGNLPIICCGLQTLPADPDVLITLQLGFPEEDLCLFLADTAPEMNVIRSIKLMFTSLTYVSNSLAFSAGCTRYLLSAGLLIIQNIY